VTSGAAGVRDELKGLVVPHDSLRTHPRNPRHRENLDDLRASLLRHGQYRPVIATVDGTLLAGNHLWLAMGELGWSECAAVRLDIDPMSEAGLRLLAVDNPTGERGGYHSPLLLEILRELAETEAGLDGSGYDSGDLEDLVAVLDAAADLDDLTDTFGEPGEDDLWPVLRFKVPPHIRDAFMDLTDPAGPDDTDRFIHLLKAAGWDGATR
jgi:hypothetical protein